MDATHVPSRRSRVVGWLLSGLAILFMIFSGGSKLVAPEPVTETFVRMGIPVHQALGLGVLELGCVLVYALPATALYGAILLTGYLGGAIALHLRLCDPWLTHTIFPCYIGALAWGGLLLREPRARALLLGR